MTKVHYYNVSLFGLLLSCLFVLPDSAVHTEPIYVSFEPGDIRGGLIVHLGCGDGEFITDLYRSDTLVHALDASADNVARARQHIKTRGLYGKVSVEQWTRETLPYVDNSVNLLIARDPGRISTKEIDRVLCPGGVAHIKTGDKWEKTVKPWPAEIDEWTHFLHGPDNNAVAHDTVVDRPRHVRWIGKPKFARAHEQLASMGSCVTAAGRLFYIIDETSQADIRFPSKWFLVARDAFNGVILWKRPVASWADQLRRFRSGPPDLQFRLVARGDKVYVTLGIDAPLSVLDAATGKTLWTYKDSDDTRQIVCTDDKLFVLIDTQPQTTANIESLIRRGVNDAPGKRAIVAFSPDADSEIWRNEIDPLVHPTLAVQDDRLFYQTKDEVFCLDAAAGKKIFNVDRSLDLKGHELGWESPTLVVYDGVVFSADFKGIIAFSASDGARMWQGTTTAGYNSPPDVFAIDNLVWIKGKGNTRNALDVTTGQIKRSITIDRTYMHDRCYRNKATDRYMLLGAVGVRFVDVDSGDVWRNEWVRGTCQYGILPANGLLYITPTSCACNMKSKLHGFWALAGRTADPTPPPSPADRLQRGPAYGGVALSSVRSDTPWPTYRHDPSRSGISDTTIGRKLKQQWRLRIGGPIAGATVDYGRAFVAAIDEHAVHAIDIADGSITWSYTAGGRIDSPPTIYKQMVLFGSADGYIYALSALNGKLIWRFQAAPRDRRMFVNGQLESVWPVHGSILVKDDEIIAAAGRSSYLDGGIHLYRLEPATGQLISQTVIYSPDPATGAQPEAIPVKDVRGVKSDILLADGDDVYMRHVKLDLETGDETGTGVHLFTPVGFLDDTWWHRGYWIIADEFISHWSNWWKIGNLVPSGRILSYDKTKVYGYGRDKYVSGNTGQWRGGEKYHLFAMDRKSSRQPQPGNRQKGLKATRQAKPNAPALKYHWSQRIPFNVTAMVVAGDQMFIAGPPDLTRTPEPAGDNALKLDAPQESLAAWKGRKGALLWSVSPETGDALTRYKLDSAPIFDGMIAADGKLLISLQDGSLLCMR